VTARFTPDGRWLISTDQEGDLLAWDLQSDSAEPALEVRDLGGPLAISPDGLLAAGGRSNGVVRLWTVAIPSDGEPTFRNLRDDRAPLAAVSALDFDPRSARLAVGHVDGRVRIWPLEGDERARTFRAHGSGLRAVTFHPEGRWLATAGSDGSVKLWNPDELDEPALILRVPGQIREVRFNPAGTRLAAASGQGTAHVWDVAEQRELGRLDHRGEPVMSLVFSPDGEALATGSADGRVRLWDIGHALAVEDDAGHVGPVRGVAFSPDGTRLASAGADGALRLWEVTSGAQLRAFHNDPTARATGIAFISGGKRLVSAASDGSLSFWDIEAGGRHQRSVSTQPAELFSLAASDERDLVATGGDDGMIRLWYLHNGQEKRGIYRHSGTATSVAFSPDGHLLASGAEDRTIRVMDLNMDWIWKSIDDLPGEVGGMVFSPDGAELAYAVGTEPIQIWRMTTNVYTKAGPTGSVTNWLDFHPDGLRLGLPRDDGTALIVHRDNDESVTLRGHRGKVKALRFSPDGLQAATSSDDGTVRLWDVETGRPRWRGPALLHQPPQLLTHRGWMTLPELEVSGETEDAWRSAIEERARLAVESPDHRLGCLHSYDGQVEIWDIAGDRELRREDLAALDQLIATESGCLTLSEGSARVHDRESTRDLGDEATALAAGDPGLLLMATGGEVRVIDVATGESLRSLETGRGVRAMLRLDDRLVLGFSDGDLELIDFEGPSRRGELVFESPPASPPVALVSGPLGILAVGYESGAVGLWSLHDGSRLIAFRLHGPIRHLRIINGTLVAATELGDLRVIDLSGLELDECELMHQVWSHAPLVWSEGSLRGRPPPEGHRCRQQ
jgi:WD40 repeat protein